MSVSGLSEIGSLGMAQTVTIRAFLGVTGNAQRSYGPPLVYPCRIQEEARPIFTAAGQQVVSTTSIEVYPRATDGTVLATISADALITLPDGTSPRILRVGTVPDISGNTVYWRIMT